MKKDPAHLRNVIALAYADSTLKEREEAFITALGRKMGYDEKEIASIIRSGPSLQIELPDRQTDRVRYLRDFIGMIMADGEIAPSEESMCRTFARSMGFDGDIISSYIEKTREYLRLGYSANAIVGEIDNFVKGSKRA
jgi:uncharacterized tellurite resistance protein B-like protein